MARKSNIPIKPRYDYATRAAYQLLVLFGISSFPVDPFEIIERFGWLLYTYSEADALDAKYPFKSKPSAQVIYVRATNQYIIIYDNTINSSDHIRWSLAHEIGHILLKHLVDFDKTALARGGLTEQEYGVLELEAHQFASEFLAPTNVLAGNYFPREIQMIGLACHISKEAAEKKYASLTGKRLVSPSAFLTADSVKVSFNFYEHMRTGGYLISAYHKALEYSHAPSVYSEMCKTLRICNECHSFIINGAQHCHVCGTAVPHPSLFQPPMKPPKRIDIGGIWDMTLADYGYIDGVQYYEFPHQKGRLHFCPLCKMETDGTGKTCKNCGSPLIATCIECGQVLNSPSRYCPNCGGETTMNSVYKNIPQRMEHKDLILGSKYNDYIPCDYWYYVVSTIRTRKKNKQLFAMLEDSVAYYDCEDMQIFMSDSTAANYVDENLTTVLECLIEYAYSSVKNIGVTCL